MLMVGPILVVSKPIVSRLPALQVAVIQVLGPSWIYYISESTAALLVSVESGVLSTLILKNGNSMYWIEKIDLVKKKFQAADFKDPYKRGGEIIEKIIVRLFESTWQNFYEAENKAVLLKRGVLVKTCTVKQLYHNELPLLRKDRSFWLLLINLPMGPDLRVYDCNYSPIRHLLYLSSGRSEQQLCIVDKKYLGLLFFKINTDTNTVEIYEMGASHLFLLTKPQ